MQKKIAVLTSGGDSPGMNAAVMEVARSAAKAGMHLVGIKHGNGPIGVPRPSDNYTILSLDTVWTSRICRAPPAHGPLPEFLVPAKIGGFF